MSIQKHDNPEIASSFRNIKKFAATALVIGCGNLALTGADQTYAADNTALADLDVSRIVNLTNDGFYGQYSPVNSKPSGFNTGVVTKRSRVARIRFSEPSGDWSFALISSPKPNQPLQCGWLIDTVIAEPTINPFAENPCSEFEQELKEDSDSFTSDKNCPDNKKCVDGTPVKITIGDNCNPVQMGNYATDYRSFNNVTYPQTRGGLYTKIRRLKPEETVFWRYVTRDKNAVSIRTNLETIRGKARGGWGFVDRDCLPDDLPHGNTSRKDNDTRPGPRG